MVHRVKHIGVAQLAKVMGILYLALGVVIGVCFWAFSSLVPKGPMASAMFPMGGIVMLIAFPVLYGLIGFLAGAMVAWLYNLAAGWVGGVEFELEPTGTD